MTNPANWRKLPAANEAAAERRGRLGKRWGRRNSSLSLIPGADQPAWKCPLPSRSALGRGIRSTRGNRKNHTRNHFDAIRVWNQRPDKQNALRGFLARMTPAQARKLVPGQLLTLSRLAKRRKLGNGRSDRGYFNRLAKDGRIEVRRHGNKTVDLWDPQHWEILEIGSDEWMRAKGFHESTPVETQTPNKHRGSPFNFAETQE